MATSRITAGRLMRGIRVFPSRAERGSTPWPEALSPRATAAKPTVNPLRRKAVIRNEAPAAPGGGILGRATAGVVPCRVFLLTSDVP